MPPRRENDTYSKPTTSCGTYGASSDAISSAVRFTSSVAIVSPRLDERIKIGAGLRTSNRVGEQPFVSLIKAFR